MTKKLAQPELEHYQYWQGRVCPRHPRMHNLAPTLARRFIQYQVKDIPKHGGLAKMVYWFLQGPQVEPLYPICFTITDQLIAVGTSRTLAAYLMQAPWQVLVRSRTGHHGIITDAQELDSEPSDFANLLGTRPKTWHRDLGYCRTLLNRMTINLELEPLKLLRIIQAQVEQLKHLDSPLAAERCNAKI